MNAWQWAGLAIAAWLTMQLPLGHLIGRRFRQRTHRRPAGESGYSPEPARPQQPPKQRPPLPGPAPAQAATPTTPPGLGTTRCFDIRATGWDCGCLIIRDNLRHKQRRDLCERHQFAAEWNERLAQS